MDFHLIDGDALGTHLLANFFVSIFSPLAAPTGWFVTNLLDATLRVMDEPSVQSCSIFFSHFMLNCKKTTKRRVAKCVLFATVTKRSLHYASYFCSNCHRMMTIPVQNKVRYYAIRMCRFVLLIIMCSDEKCKELSITAERSSIVTADTKYLRAFFVIIYDSFSSRREYPLSFYYHPRCLYHQILLGT